VPIQKCNNGHKYGNTGKCYKGKGSRAKAARQGRAIEASKSKRGR